MKRSSQADIPQLISMNLETNVANWRRLKRELSESELAPSQFDQTIEHRCEIAKACRQVLLHAVKDLLQMIDDRGDAEHPLNHHAIIAFAVLTKSPVDQFFTAFAEAQITEHFGLIGPGLSDLAKVLVVRIGSGPPPVNNLPLGKDPATRKKPGRIPRRRRPGR